MCIFASQSMNTFEVNNHILFFVVSPETCAFYWRSDDSVLKKWRVEPLPLEGKNKQFPNTHFSVFKKE